MRNRKLKACLEPGKAGIFRDSLFKGHNEKHTLTLVEFNVTESRVMWRMQTGSGQQIEGRLGDQVRIPFLPEDCWITLHIPIQVHKRNRGTLAPDFIMMIPESYVLEFER